MVVSLAVALYLPPTFVLCSHGWPIFTISLTSILSFLLLLLIGCFAWCLNDALHARVVDGWVMDRRVVRSCVHD